jgi:hypothetical protein
VDEFLEKLYPEGNDQALRNARELTLNLIETTGCSVGKLDAGEAISVENDTTQHDQNHEGFQSEQITSLQACELG